MEKMKKWLTVMEVDFLETMYQNLMKLLGHVAIVPIQPPCNSFANGCMVFKLGKKQIMFYVFFSSK